jgi:DivIVA domain-containing protein
VPLTPEEIERRTFSIEERGYHRDEVRRFLVEVAAAVRYALHNPMLSTGPRPAPAAPSGARARGGVTEDGFDILGDEVANILRATHDVVQKMRAEAEAEGQAIRDAARSDAEELRRQSVEELRVSQQEAEAEIVWQQERVKRLLITAKEQADSIVAEAAEQARALVSAAEEQAADRVAVIESQAHQHAEQILRAERDAVRRLRAAQDDLLSAIERLTGSETRPVLDLTALTRPVVRSGQIDPGAPGRADEPTAATTAAPSETTSEEPTETPHGTHHGAVRAAAERPDPIQQMIASAVSRAVEGSSQLVADGGDVDHPEG